MATFAGARRVLHIVTAGVLSLVLIAGCSVDESPSRPATSVAARIQPANRGTEIMTALRLALDQYWRTRLPEVTPVAAFAPPTGWIAYTDAAHGQVRNGCSLLRQNAIYCTRAKGIFYSTDWLDMLDRNHSRTANMATVVVLAHEYGHHISALHARDFKLAIGRELQADCYAGAFVRGISVGGYPLTLENGDVEDARTTLGRIADDTSIWSDPKAHGGPPDRMAAFSRGYQSNDPGYCEAYEKTGPILTRAFGSVDYRLPAAATVEDLTGGVVRFSTLTESEFTTDVTTISENLSAEPVAALTSYQAKYFSGSQVRVVVPAWSPAWQPGGFSLAVVDYEQQHPQLGLLHGKLILAGRSDGTRVLFDSYARGAAPVTTDGWASLVSFADVIISGLN